MSHTEALTLEDSAPERRGVLALYEHVTGRRMPDDIIKYKLGLRDALLLLIGAAGMWGTQVATQGKTQAAIDLLANDVKNFQRQQAEATTAMQLQIDDNRRQTASAKVDTAELAKDVAELKGFLAGAGIKVPAVRRKE